MLLGRYHCAPVEASHGSNLVPFSLPALGGHYRYAGLVMECTLITRASFLHLKVDEEVHLVTHDLQQTVPEQGRGLEL
jgi:hypothetical protein